MKDDMYAQSTEDSFLRKDGDYRLFSFFQPYDGIFKLDVWCRYRTSGDAGRCDFEIDGKCIAREARMKSLPYGVYGWHHIGVTTLTKGLHNLKQIGRTKNKQAGVFVKTFLITEDSELVRSGKAERILKEGQQLGTNRTNNISNEDRALHNKKMALEKRKIESKNRKDMDDLKRMGFVEDLPFGKASECKCRNGVPLGGIGAGKIEIDPGGVITGVTINNNQDVIIYRTPGSFFALSLQYGDKKIAKVLAKEKIAHNFPCVEEVEFEGIFPQVHCHYKDSDIPLEIRLHAFSPIIPYDVDNSSLPVVFFDFYLKNVSPEDMTATIAFSWENLLGTGGTMAAYGQDINSQGPNVMNTWNPGFTWSNRSGNSQHVKFGNPLEGMLFMAKSDHGNLNSYGTYAIATPKNNLEFSYQESWISSGNGQDFWKYFSRNGKLPNKKSRTHALEGERYLSGAIAKTIKLEKGEHGTISFILGWHMPHNLGEKGDNGVYYAKRFENAWQVANYACIHKDYLRKGTLELLNLFKKSNLPFWLYRKILNDLFPLVTCSWLTYDGKFSINEAPSGMMGCLGTMDQRLSSNSIYTVLFPELDKKEMALFRKCQGEDGAMPHELGYGFFDDKPRGYQWPDISSSFILQTYRYFIYTADEEYLKISYPHIKKALQWQASLDKDGDGIPDLCPGVGTTYDNYKWHGANAFVTSLWLATLRVGEKISIYLEDYDFAKICRNRFKIAQKNMVKKLWVDKSKAGRYFLNYNDSATKKIDESCCVSQLAGQWFADLMDLGNLVPEDFIKMALKTIYKLNINLKGNSMTDLIKPNGECAYSETAFLQYAETYFGCLAIHRGLINEGLKVFEKIDCAVKEKRCDWNVPLNMTSGELSGLPYYMTNPASFFLLYALSGFVPDMVQKRLVLRPRLLPGKKALHLPLLSTCFWGWLDYEEGKKVTYKVKLLKNNMNKDIWFDKVELSVPVGCRPKRVNINGRTFDEWKMEENRIIINRKFIMKKDIAFFVDIF